MDQTMSPEALDALSPRELFLKEREIANKHTGGLPWGIILWGFTNAIVWLSLWPLVLLGYLPLWAGFLIATFNLILAYLPSHDAQHDIIAKPGEPLRWLNELLGHVSVIPMTSSFRILRHTHIEHHKFTNHPEKDPDFSTSASGPLDFLKKHIMTEQPASPAQTAYRDTLVRIGKERLALDQLAIMLVERSFLIGLAVSGFALEAFLIGWLPKKIGNLYIRYYLSYRPHNPGLGQGRYRDTHAFRSHLGNVISLGMQYHIVHHLHPRIPLFRTKAAYEELRPILEKRGCDLDNL